MNENVHEVRNTCANICTCVYSVIWHIQSHKVCYKHNHHRFNYCVTPKLHIYICCLHGLSQYVLRHCVAFICYYVHSRHNIINTYHILYTVTNRKECTFHCLLHLPSFPSEVCKQSQ
jgi:hypothetical protein